ncbi:MAG: dioxygenase [Planctomycetota bacterium]|nr:MAG: dioxygenase [Planctomycetota bacterium]
MNTRTTLFVSHGAPDVLLRSTEAHAFLAGLGAVIGKPRAIAMVSAHWGTRTPEVDDSAAPATIHDFSGFAPELGRWNYPATGAPREAELAIACLARAGITARATRRGLDHGAWVPLSLAFPRGEIPVFQIALQPLLGPAHHLALGRALAPLREQGVLVIGSGGATHDLRSADPNGGALPDWVAQFDAWLGERAVEGDAEALVDYRARGPQAARNHPTEEHYLPLLVALGAAGVGARGRKLHASNDYKVLSMAAYAFDAAS